jgi:hypothetical protein
MGRARLAAGPRALEQLIEAGVLRYADDAGELPRRRCGTRSAVAAAARALPARDDLGRERGDHAHCSPAEPLETGYVELVVPIFRVAHMYLDADDRQVGEANVFPPAMRLDRPTLWRTCTYSGSPLPARPADERDRA